MATLRTLRARAGRTILLVLLAGLGSCTPEQPATEPAVEAPGRPATAAQASGRPSVARAVQTDAPLHFRRLTIDEGLSQNAVNALLQDRRGFFWFGTKDGLNSYDGYAFTVFRHDPFDPATLSSSHITALLEDRAGALWVGTHDGGLNRFDRSTGTAVRYANSPRHRITSIAEDALGEIWIGTAGGGTYRLTRSDAASPGAVFARFAHVPGDPRSLSNDTVSALLTDRRGRLWVGTEAGLNRLDPGRGFVRYAPRPGTPGGLLDSTVTALAETRDGALWIGTPLGLNRLGEDGGSVAYPFAVQRRGYGWASVAQIAEGPSGEIWLATPDGLARFDRATGAYTFLRNDPFDATSLSGNFVTVLHWDPTGVLWVGTNGYGLSLYDAKTARFATIRRPPDAASRWDGFSIRALFEDAEGFVWMSAGVLYRYDRRTGTLVSFESTSDRLADFGNTGVWSIVQDRRGALWFGSYEGLYRVDPATQRVRHYAYDPARPEGLPGKNVYGVFEDRRGRLWAVTRHHLSRLDDATAGRFTSYRHTPDTEADAGEALFPALYESGPRTRAGGTVGPFWMATETGLVRFDPQTGRTRRYRTDPADPTSLSHDQVRAICPDPRAPDRILWIGTAGGGLNRFDIRTGTFTHITERDGLPNNVVYGVLPDDAGRLWLSTNRGLARYDPRTGEVRTYDVRDGLQSNEFNAGAYSRAPDGRLYFGGIHGVTSFDPDRLTDNPHVPAVVLTGLRIGDRPVAVGDSTGLLARALWATKVLRLSHREDMVTFSFAALDFSAPEKNRYAYRMEGFDAGWIDAGANRTATYTNLPPGRYTFRVRGSNNDGVWNEAGAALALVVAPPWWRAWWAYAAYALLALGLGAALVRDRRVRQDERHRLAIEHLEAEKLREIDRSRSRFFANVSHEFRTPLTLTLGPLDDLQAGLHGPLAPPMAAQVDLARRNAGRVLDLINQILDVARLEAGRMPLRARALDLGAFVGDLARTFAPLAERKGLAFEVLAPEAPVRVWADPEHLEKVLANLLSNAVKFTPGGGTVRVAVEADAPGHAAAARGASARVASARVVVRDSGPGIPAADLPHVFDRFYRVNESSARMQPGTGIGLALAKELVDLHGGVLTAASEAGFGSTFTVALPLGRAHLAPDQIRDEPDAETGVAPRTPLPPIREPGGDGEAGKPVAGKPVAGKPVAADLVDERLLRAGSIPDDDDDVTTVLVVEDHADVRAYILRHLEPAYRVVEAADGLEGLEKARALLPDLIVSDVMMPGMDGYALCRALKADPETDYIPVILLTAKAAPEDRLEGLREHCDDYLTKPFDPAELRLRIANLIAGRRRLRARFAAETPAPAEHDALHPQPVAGVSADAAFLEAVREQVEAHLGDDTFSVERLAEGVGVSRAHLHRRLREMLGQAPSEVIRGMRLERAGGLLAARAGMVSEVAYAVGFKSVAHFSNAFHARYGCRPSGYADRAGADAA